MVVQLAHAPLPVAPAVGALSLAVTGAGGRPCEHAVQVPAVFVHEPGCASVHQQYGGHSSCMQFLVRTVHTVQQTVDPHRYSSWDGCPCACCCATTGALVGARRKLWSSAVAVLVAAVQFLDKVVVPVGATTVGRAMPGSTMVTCSASSTVAFGRFCTIFYMKG